ncbi:GIY-YIG nuclease family protein [Loigolactobacillus zhaoyuanensis]|uniref:GIY-YIG nuclease family protein n=1 Tax=Loigolactobacillus zhaoyuanensis TaxID=2486017 RepID=A0ABW8U8T8_9LACO|nr:GIY-YIG nuclease family protein [Loigolactobacillus zhaoyuanensis]
MATTKKYYFYVLLCADNTLYGGYSTDVTKRVATHNAGKGAKYTKPRTRRPVKLIFHAEFTTKTAALQAEWRFKHQPREDKLEFLQQQGVFVEF